MSNKRTMRRLLGYAGRHRVLNMIETPEGVSGKKHYRKITKARRMAEKMDSRIRRKEKKSGPREFMGRAKTRLGRGIGSPKGRM